MYIFMHNTARYKSFIISTKEVFSYLLKQYLIHSQVRDASVHEGKNEDTKRSLCFPESAFLAANTETTSRCLASRSRGLEEIPYMRGKLPTDTLLQCTYNQIFALTHSHTHKEIINNS